MLERLEKIDRHDTVADVVGDSQSPAEAEAALHFLLTRVGRDIYQSAASYLANTRSMLTTLQLLSLASNYPHTVRFMDQEIDHDPYKSIIFGQLKANSHPQDRHDIATSWIHNGRWEMLACLYERVGGIDLSMPFRSRLLPEDIGLRILNTQPKSVLTINEIVTTAIACPAWLIMTWAGLKPAVADHPTLTSVNDADKKLTLRACVLHPTVPSDVIDSLVVEDMELLKLTTNRPTEVSIRRVCDLIELSYGAGINDKQSIREWSSVLTTGIVSYLKSHPDPVGLARTVTKAIQLTIDHTDGDSPTLSCLRTLWLEYPETLNAATWRGVLSVLRMQHTTRHNVNKFILECIGLESFIQIVASAYKVAKTGNTTAQHLLERVSYYSIQKEYEYLGTYLQQANTAIRSRGL